MTMPPLPATGASGWRDTWAQAVHNAAAEVVTGRLTEAAQRAAFVAGSVYDLSGTQLPTKRLHVVLDANGEVDDLIIEDVA